MAKVENKTGNTVNDDAKRVDVEVKDVSARDLLNSLESISERMKNSKIEGLVSEVSTSLSSKVFLKSLEVKLDRVGEAAEGIEKSAELIVEGLFSSTKYSGYQEKIKEKRGNTFITNLFERQSSKAKKLNNELLDELGESRVESKKALGRLTDSVSLVALGKIIANGNAGILGILGDQLEQTYEIRDTLGVNSKEWKVIEKELSSSARVLDKFGSRFSQSDFLKAYNAAIQAGARGDLATDLVPVFAKIEKVSGSMDAGVAAMMKEIYSLDGGASIVQAISDSGAALRKEWGVTSENMYGPISDIYKTILLYSKGNEGKAMSQLQGFSAQMSMADVDPSAAMTMIQKLTTARPTDEGYSDLASVVHMFLKRDIASVQRDLQSGDYLKVGNEILKGLSQVSSSDRYLYDAFGIEEGMWIDIQNNYGKVEASLKAIESTLTTSAGAEEKFLDSMTLNPFESFVNTISKQPWLKTILKTMEALDLNTGNLLETIGWMHFLGFDKMLGSAVAKIGSLFGATQLATGLKGAVKAGVFEGFKAIFTGAAVTATLAGGLGVVLKEYYSGGEVSKDKYWTSKRGEGGSYRDAYTSGSTVLNNMQRYFGDVAGTASYDPEMAISSTGRSAKLFNDSYPVTSPYGMRTHPITGIKKMHKGVDLGTPQGTPLMSNIEGKVVASGIDPDGDYSRGNYLTLSDGSMLYDFFHLSSRGVFAGQTIKKGQRIGATGGAAGVPGSGASTGPHLHFQVTDLKSGSTVDPMPYVNGNPIYGTGVSSTGSVTNTGSVKTDNTLVSAVRGELFKMGKVLGMGGGKSELRYPNPTPASVMQYI